MGKLKRALCRLFGHRRYAGWWGDGLYGEVTGGYHDGIKRTHYQVRSTCDRCGERYILARFHGGTGALRRKEADNG